MDNKFPKNSEMPSSKEFETKDIGKDGIMSKGRWINNPGNKSYQVMRGHGAATKGIKFLDK